MMPVVVMPAARLLKGCKSLLRSGQVAILKSLPDLVEGLGNRAVGVGERTLAVTLILGQRSVGLLRSGQVSRIARAYERPEILQKPGLKARGSIVGDTGNRGNRHGASPARSRTSVSPSPRQPCKASMVNEQ